MRPSMPAYVDDDFRILTNPPDAQGESALFLVVRASAVPAGKASP